MVAVKILRGDIRVSLSFCCLAKHPPQVKFGGGDEPRDQYLSRQTSSGLLVCLWRIG